MKEIILDGLASHIEEGTIQTWFVEENDPINEGDDLVEVSTEEGTITITSPSTGILAEVYYDEGEVVSRGEIICTVDDNEDYDEDEDEEDEDDDEDEDGEDEDHDEEDDKNADDEDFEDEDDSEDEDEFDDEK